MKEEFQDPYVYKARANEGSAPKLKVDSTGIAITTEKITGSQLPENGSDNSKTQKKRLKIKTRISPGKASGESVPSHDERSQVNVSLPVAWPAQPEWSYAKPTSFNGNNASYKEDLDKTRSQDIKADRNGIPLPQTYSGNNRLSVISSKIPPVDRLPAKADITQHGQKQKTAGDAIAPLNKPKQWEINESGDKKTPEHSPPKPEPDDNKPQIKHRKTALPPSAMKFMEEQETRNTTGKDKIQARKSSSQNETEGKKFRSSQIALLMVAAALVLATTPLWPDSLNLTEFDIYWIMMIAGSLVTLEILLLPQHKAARILCVLILSMLVAVLTLFIFADRLPSHFQNLIFTYNIFDYLSNSNILAASLMLVTGSIIVINFSFSIARKIAIMFTIATAVIVPFAPLPMLKHPPPITIPTDLTEAKFLQDWSISDRGWNFIQWTNRNNEQDRLTVVYFHPAELNTIATKNNSARPQNILLSYIKVRANEQGMGPVSTLTFAQNPENQRFISFGPNNRTMDAMTIESKMKEGHYLILFEVTDYSAKKSYISEFYQMIKL